jgi:hypothetical protein
VAWIEGDEGFWGLTCDFAEVFEGFIFTAVCGCAVGCWPQPVEARYQLFLSGDGEVSWGFRYLKNHPFEAVERKPKAARRMTVIRTPMANVIMLPPGLRCSVSGSDAGQHRNDQSNLNSQETHYAYRFRI